VDIKKAKFEKKSNKDYKRYAAKTPDFSRGDTAAISF